VRSVKERARTNRDLRRRSGLLRTLACERSTSQCAGLRVPFPTLWRDQLENKRGPIANLCWAGVGCCAARDAGAAGTVPSFARVAGESAWADRDLGWAGLGCCALAMRWAAGTVPYPLRRSSDGGCGAISCCSLFRSRLLRVLIARVAIGCCCFQLRTVAHSMLRAIAIASCARMLAMLLQLFLGAWSPQHAAALAIAACRARRSSRERRCSRGLRSIELWIDRMCKAQLKRDAIFLRAHHSSRLKYKAAGTALGAGGSCTAAPSCKRVAALQ
jgi:hypothetical protein